MNQYSSAMRTLVARNVLGVTIAPPAVLTIPVLGGFQRQIFDGGYHSPSVIWQDQSNLILHRIGLFSNFADGLVWGTPPERARVNIAAVAYQNGPVLSGTSITTYLNSKALDGTPDCQFLLELAPGALIIQGTQPYIVDNVFSNTSAVLSDYGRGLTTPAASVRRLVPGYASAVQTTFYGLTALNYFHDWEAFLPIGSIAAAFPVTPPDGFLLFGSVLIDQPVDLLTNSIDVSFGRSPLYMDIMAEYEISPS